MSQKKSMEGGDDQWWWPKKTKMDTEELMNREIEVLCQKLAAFSISDASSSSAASTAWSPKPAEPSWHWRRHEDGWWWWWSDDLQTWWPP